MARKFNSGRLGEQLMNNDLFEAYNRIKYIGSGLEQPTPQYQTPIIDSSLWTYRYAGSDVNTDMMKVYDESSKTWRTLFEGYYHPASLLVQPQFPVDGQIYINSSGQILYYQNNQWNPAYAGMASDINSIAAGIGNFVILNDMAYIVGGNGSQYVVPLMGTGKLFDNQQYVKMEDFGGSNMTMQYPINGGTKQGELDWVHVNPVYLYGAEKRFIKVIDKEEYIINITTNNTEIYGFMAGEPVGTLLRDFDIYDKVDDKSDYRKVSGGIQLINDATKYDYIYAITYKFDTVESKFGSLIRGTATIGDNNDIFVGQINGFPLVFLNGMYLEQNDYTYTKEEGMLSIPNASITNEVDISVAAFADIVRDMTVSVPDETLRPPFEFTVTPSDVNANGEIELYHEYIKQVEKFEHPVAFVQGVANYLYDPEYGFTDAIEIDSDNGKLIVKNFGPMSETLTSTGTFALADEDPTPEETPEVELIMEDGEGNDFIGTELGEILAAEGLSTGAEVKVLIADIGAALLSGGILTNTNEINDPEIYPDKKYLVFVNGICLAPSDLEIMPGTISISGTKVVSGNDNKYVLMSLEKGDTGIDLLFDSVVSYFTTQIDDKQASNIYNDCNMAVAYAIKDGEYNGVLVDLNHIEQKITGERSYATGEILKVKDEDLSGGFTYEYKIYNVHGDYTWTDFVEEYGPQELISMNNMITQFNGKGSISIMSNDTLKGAHLEYYAYTYADETDEPILKGRMKCKMAVKNHREDAGIPEKQFNYVSRMHYYYPTKKGILGTFVNGIQTNYEEVENVAAKFSIDTPESINFYKNWGTEADLYNLLKTINEETTLQQLAEYREGEFATELKDYAITESLLDKLKSLAAVVAETEADNELFYFVERIENGETYSVNRDWLGHGNRFINFDNTYAATAFMGPGMVDVYLNGVMLDRSSYSVFNNNHIMLNDLKVAGGSDEYDLEKPNTHSLIKYYVDVPPGDCDCKGKVIRFNCESPDELLVEYRPDTTLRKISYELKEVTYDMNGVMPYENYEFPASLLNTKDEIKIWIDGILHTGGYYIEGKDIVLENCPLKLDPIKEYFNANPDTYQEWKKLNGEYTYTRSRIIFEWR